MNITDELDNEKKAAFRRRVIWVFIGYCTRTDEVFVTFRRVTKSGQMYHEQYYPGASSLERAKRLIEGRLKPC